MQEIRRTALEHKYTDELHCNEIMLLPYYIASMNIEHEFYTQTGSYLPFEKICLADTYELVEAEDPYLPNINEENAERAQKQQETPMFVVIGNPPYNIRQINENDNNKNRQYEVVDQRVAETYAKDSKATNKNALGDPYAKAMRWASDRIGDEGVVAFVTNNSFLDSMTFDGMRKHLAEECDAIYILDLGGNVRKGSKGLRHNAQRVRDSGRREHQLFSSEGATKWNSQRRPQYFTHRVDEFWNKEHRIFAFSIQREHYRKYRVAAG